MMEAKHAIKKPKIEEKENEHENENENDKRYTEETRGFNSSNQNTVDSACELMEVEETCFDMQPLGGIPPSEPMAETVFSELHCSFPNKNLPFPPTIPNFSQQSSYNPFMLNDPSIYTFVHSAPAPVPAPLANTYNPSIQEPPTFREDCLLLVRINVSLRWGSAYKFKTIKEQIREWQEAEREVVRNVEQWNRTVEKYSQLSYQALNLDLKLLVDLLSRAVPLLKLNRIVR